MPVYPGALPGTVFSTGTVFPLYFLLVWLLSFKASGSPARSLLGLSAGFIPTGSFAKKSDETGTIGQEIPLLRVEPRDAAKIVCREPPLAAVRRTMVGSRE